nr:uncharacterized protein LOC111507768 isoform X2 [Leptinotarsa decemlineata]
MKLVITMKLTLLLVCIFSTTFAQRGSFAGNRVIGVPDQASRFTNGTTDGSTSDSNLQFAGRFSSNETSSTLRIPVDARGDENLVKRLETWPRENRPFWLVNAQLIESQRDPLGTRNNFQDSSQGQEASYPTLRNRIQPGISQVQNNSEEDWRLVPCLKPVNSTSFFIYGDRGVIRQYIYDPVKDGWFRKTHSGSD